MRDHLPRSSSTSAAPLSVEVIIISCSLHHNHVYTNHEEKNAGADGPLGNKEAVMQILAFHGEEKQCRKCKIEARV